MAGGDYNCSSLDPLCFQQLSLSPPQSSAICQSGACVGPGTGFRRNFNLVSSLERHPCVKCSCRMHVHTKEVYKSLFLMPPHFCCTFLRMLLFLLHSTHVMLVRNLAFQLPQKAMRNSWTWKYILFFQSLFQIKSNSICNETFLDPRLPILLRPPGLSFLHQHPRFSRPQCWRPPNIFKPRLFATLPRPPQIPSLWVICTHL